MRCQKLRPRLICPAKQTRGRCIGPQTLNVHQNSDPETNKADILVSPGTWYPPASILSHGV